MAVLSDMFIKKNKKVYEELDKFCCLTMYTNCIKAEANELFSELGIDMSSAVNIFLRQCILHGGLPFKVEVPKFNAETLAAMQEARDIMSGKIQATSYNTTDELLKALNAED